MELGATYSLQGRESEKVKTKIRYHREDRPSFGQPLPELPI